MSSNLVTGLFIMASMACTVIGNLLLKTGVQQPGLSTIWPLSLLNIRTALGAVTFSFAMVFYMMVLKRIPLNLAQSIFALQFVLVIIAANVILREPIGTQRWMGVGLIAAGLFIISLTPPTSLQ
jgi:undecaprenyl phosphate-alpha-L-ara4N flippase subunit ArnE